jgi:hypothetical protein
LIRLDDPKGRAMCDEVLGVIRFGQGLAAPDLRGELLAETATRLERALRYFSQAGEQLWTARTRWGLARLAKAEGRAPDADRLRSDAEAAYRQLGAAPQSGYEPWEEVP